MDVLKTCRGDISLQLRAINDECSEVHGRLLENNVHRNLSGTVFHINPELDSQISVKSQGFVTFLNLKVLSALHFILNIHGQTDTIVLLETWEEEVQGGGVKLEGERLWDVCALGPEVDLVYL